MLQQGFRANPSALRPRGEGGLEAHHCLGEVFLSGEANAGNPSLGLRVEAVEEAEAVLHLHQLCRGLALELLAKVIPAYLSLFIVEKEEHMLLLILNSVEPAGTLSVDLISEGHTLGEVADAAVVTGDFGHVVSVLKAAKCFACHSCNVLRHNAGYIKVPPWNTLH